MIAAASIALGLLARPVSGAEAFKGLIECARAARVCSIARASVVSTPARDFAVLVAPRAGKEGFWVFAPDEALFFELAAAPVERAAAVEPASWKNLWGFLSKISAGGIKHKADPHAYFKVELGFSDPVFLSFKREPGAPISMESAQAVPYVGREPDAQKGQSVTIEPEAAQLLRETVLAQVATVHSTWAGAPAPNPGDVSEEYNLVGREGRITYKRADCVKALEACSAAPELREAVRVELAKFPQ